MGRSAVSGHPATALELRNAARRWPGGEPVFRNMHLRVLRGQVTVLLGPSGCGKSTLLRCAASLDPMEEGTIEVDGRQVHRPSPERQLILQDDRQLLPWLTVAGNIAFPARMIGRGRSDRSSVDRLLELVGLPGSADAFPARLSGGMRQRAVLARALAAEPSILLLDEPFGALDSDTRRKLHDALLQVHRARDLAILLVTHDVAEALVLADTLVFMDRFGALSPREENPLPEPRRTDSLEFFRASNGLRRRYESLVDPIDR